MRNNQHALTTYFYSNDCFHLTNKILTIIGVVYSHYDLYETISHMFSFPKKHRVTSVKDWKNAGGYYTRNDVRVSFDKLGRVCIIFLFLCVESSFSRWHCASRTQCALELFIATIERANDKNMSGCSSNNTIVLVVVAFFLFFTTQITRNRHT
jgi:hypothetical protein